MAIVARFVLITRLDKTAQVAMDLGFDYFGSAVTISPHKNSQTIQQHRNRCAKDRPTISQVISRKSRLQAFVSVRGSHIYRQCYCGCVYAAQAQNIDLVQIKKDATASCWIRMLKKDYSHKSLN